MPYKDREKRLACQRAYTARNKEKIALRMKFYNIKNQKHRSEYKKKYNLEHAEEIKQKRQAKSKEKTAYDKLYFQKNKERMMARNKAYDKLHREEMLEAHRKWAKKNRHKKREYVQKRMTSDPGFKLSYILRSRIRHAIKNNSKFLPTMQLIGCSIPELRSYIEKQFKDGMTWENYGLYGWHIDHIRPLASFDLFIPEEQRKAFHYSNLQPLWAKENYKKGFKLNYQYASHP